MTNIPRVISALDIYITRCNLLLIGLKRHTLESYFGDNKVHYCEAQGPQLSLHNTETTYFFTHFECVPKQLAQHSTETHPEFAIY